MTQDEERRRYSDRDTLHCTCHGAILSDHLTITLPSTTMPVTAEELEAAIRKAIQVEHVEVEDNSGGCGEKFSVLIVSKVP